VSKEDSVEYLFWIRYRMYQFLFIHLSNFRIRKMKQKTALELRVCNELFECGLIEVSKNCAYFFSMNSCSCFIQVYSMITA